MHHSAFLGMHSQEGSMSQALVHFFKDLFIAMVSINFDFVIYSMSELMGSYWVQSLSKHSLYTLLKIMAKVWRRKF